MKFLITLLGSAGGVLLLAFVLSMVFSAQIALQPAGIIVAATGIIAISTAWALQTRMRHTLSQ